jgi:hypothetical protein
MTWREFLAVRNGLERPGLVPYVDKIAQQKMAEECGIEVPRTYIACPEKIWIVRLLKSLDCYVAKLTHNSFSEGLIIVKHGINIITGEPITPEEVQERMYAGLHTRPRDVESWALHHVTPGFMIQEYVQNRMEVKIQTIWGKAIIGEWRGGEQQCYTTPIWGRYDRSGTRVDGDYDAPEWWPKAIEAAERIAQDTDALRVDFLVRDDGTLLLNELEIWTESNWSSMKYALEAALNDGYRSYCSS